MRIAVGLAAIVSLILLTSFAPKRPAFSDKSVVQVKIESGGSGTAVHIGQGRFLTAAHVVGANKTVTLLAEGQDFPATVLWSSDRFDLALVESEGASSLAFATLSCRNPGIGEAIESVGFPGPFGLTRTHGFIAGEAIPINDIPVIASNVVLYPGMSGGPTIDKDGYIVGFNNSIAVAQLGPFQSSLSGLSLLVPALSACKLLARV